MQAHIGMRVPRSISSSRVADLYETDSLFRQPPGEKQLASEGIGFALSDSVKIEDVLWLAGEIDHAGGFQLHARRQFIRFQTGGHFGLDGVTLSKLLVQFRQR